MNSLGALENLANTPATLVPDPVIEADEDVAVIRRAVGRNRTLRIAATVLSGLSSLALGAAGLFYLFTR